MIVKHGRVIVSEFDPVTIEGFTFDGGYEDAARQAIRWAITRLQECLDRELPLSWGIRQEEPRRG